MIYYFPGKLHARRNFYSQVMDGSAYFLFVNGHPRKKEI